MERMRDGVRPELSARLRTLGQAPGSLARLANTWTAPGSLVRLADIWTAPGALARLRTLGRRLGLWLDCGHLDGAWVSGSVYLEKVPAFFDFAGTFFDAKPIEAHRGSFHCAIWLDAGTFSNRISYRPANKLTGTDPRTSLLTLPREGDVSLAVGHHKIVLDQSLHISHIQWIFLRLKS